MTELFYGKHKRKTLAVYLILLALWLGFIFSNSLATGPESAEQSNKVVEFIQNIVRFFDSEAMVDASAVRTTAHFFEFFVLGTLYSIGTFFFKGNRASLFSFSLSLSLFTALIDETVQLFSEGRGAQVTDVWVDFSGAFIAHLIMTMVYLTYKRKNSEA